jgi:DNA polymerase I-like protein with 3'-5' exonuclease and polymerase domains
MSRFQDYNFETLKSDPLTWKKVYFDFESKEELDIVKYGSNWPWGGCKPLCCSVINIDTGEGFVTSDWDYLKQIVENCHTISAHNVLYDMGIMLQLGINIWDALMVDTYILAALYDNTVSSFSLNYLLDIYFNEKKSEMPMALWAIKNRKYIKGFQNLKCLSRVKYKKKYYSKAPEFRHVNKRNGTKEPWKPPATGPVRTREQKDKVKKSAVLWCKKNMDIIYEQGGKETVDKYCLDDSLGGAKLYNFFIKDVDQWHVDLFSDVCKCLLQARQRGVPVHIKTLQASRDVLYMKERAAYDKFVKISGGKIIDVDGEDVLMINGMEVNLASPTKLSKYLVSLGHTPEFNEETNNYSIDHAWIESAYKQTEDERLKCILEYRRFQVPRNNFCDKILEFLELTDQMGGEYGRIYPQLKPLGADASGRMTGSKPNIQQMSSIDKDPEVGTLIRDIFHPEPGEDWYTYDWSAQEPRLQAHFASAEGMESADTICDEWNLNPYMDVHVFVGKGMFPEMNTLDESSKEFKKLRKYAKGVNLGISYGMGKKKLYGTALGVGWEDGEVIYNIYMDKFPYIKDMGEKCMDEGKRVGYVTSVTGRKIGCPKTFYSTKAKRWIDLSYKMFNYKIQGSGADLLYISLAMCYRMGIPIYFPVHDEINFSTKSIDIAKKVKYIMENGIKLKVPMIVGTNRGKTWADACVNEIEL